ncbi:MULTISPECIES: sensor histidine kinase [unclassified Cryobacterium]|uniref:sensor histidine kinase n=1 Tax=unclassified Cryobacterium TaxID=2649013 RepID=UPI002B222413|nr:MULTISPECIES: ATP-binding protein [unclassified Cryobacterium]MEA9998052.1 ATP-binding protein [Cryobacterium sp. RTS3]MEB0266946.1 ATP-binding protein [Cryobacterium sp. 10I5]
MSETGTNRAVRSNPSRLDRSVFLSQLLLAGATLFLVAVTGLTAIQRLSAPMFFLGVLLIFIVTAVSALVTWSDHSKYWIILLPVVDIIAIVLIWQAQAAIGASFLLVLPVIWLSTHFGARGAAGSVILAAVMIWGGTLFRSVPISLADVPQLAMIPAMLGFVAVTTHLTTKRAAAQRVLLTQQAGLFESALRRSRRQEQTLDELFNAVDFGVVGFDRTSTANFLNRAQRELLALYGTSDNRPAVVSTVFHEDRVTAYAESDRPYSRALRGETIDRLTVWVGEPGQQQAALLVSARPIIDDNGDYDGGVMVSRDVTAEVRAIQARDDLVASVSHELRTPLTSILGYLELALDDERLDPSTRGMLEVASKNSDRLLEMVSGLLTDASDSKHEPLLNVAPCDLAGIVTDALESAGPSAAKRSIGFDVDALPAVTVEADAFRLRQVVDNVLSNAIKYNVDAGRIGVTLAVDDGLALLRISDTGRGMTAEEQTKLFDRFYRADSVRNSSVHGTGLGLSISRDIMRKHGGDLRLESTKGKGSVVVFTLPLTSVASR